MKTRPDGIKVPENHDNWGMALYEIGMNTIRLADMVQELRERIEKLEKKDGGK